MLSTKRFEIDLRNFVDIFNKVNVDESPFVIYNQKPPFAEQQTTVTYNNVDYRRNVTIVLNPVYNTPQLYFNFYTDSGSLLLLDEVRTLIGAVSDPCWAYVTQNEHPVHAVAYYNVHPCGTGVFMGELGPADNYIVSWFSVYGSLLGMRLGPGSPEQTLKASSSAS